MTEKKFDQKKQNLNDMVEVLQKKYGTERISLEMIDQYYNMAEKNRTSKAYC